MKLTPKQKYFRDLRQYHRICEREKQENKPLHWRKLNDNKVKEFLKKSLLLYERQKGLNYLKEEKQLSEIREREIERKQKREILESLLLLLKTGEESIDKLLMLEK